MTGLVSLGPTSNVRRQADQDDMSKAFATTVLGAAAAGMTEDAMKLYDQGVEQFGPSFRDTYYTLRDQAAAVDEKFGPSEPRPILNTVEAIPTTVGVPTSVVSPREGERLASGLRSLDAPAVDDNKPADYVAEPDQPRASGLGRATALPVVRDDALIKVGEGAVDANTPTSTGYKMTLSGLPRTEGGKGGIFGAGGLPRSPEMQGPPQSTEVDLDRALTDKAYRESIIPTPDQPIVMPRDNTQLPFLRPDRNEASAIAGQSFRGTAKEEAVARGVPLEQVEAERAAELEKARLADNPPAPAPADPAAPIATAAAASPPPDMTGGYGVGALSGLPVPAEADPSFSFRTKETVSGRTGGGVPRGIRPVVAPPSSGGIASLASPPPAPPPGPVANGPPIPAPPQAAPAAAPAETPAEPAEDGPSPYWEALIQGGLATMASQNPNALSAIGEGGMKGVEQVGVIRKNLRDDRKEKSEAEYRKGSLANQREGLDVQRSAITSQDRRAAEEIQARRDMQVQEIQSRNQLLDKQLSHALQLKGIEVSSQFALLNARGDIEAQLLSLKEQYERDGIQFKYDTAFDFLTKKAGLPKEAAGIMAAGFAPPKDGDGKTRSPMGEDETKLAFDIAAGSIMGEGATGPQMMDALPPNVKAEVAAEVSKRDDPSGGAAAVLGVLKKNNIVPHDGTWGFGLFGSKTLKQAGPPANAGGSYTYVPGQGAVPK